MFGLVKEFIIDIFGKEHDSFVSSMQDLTFYMVGGGTVECAALSMNRRFIGIDKNRDHIRTTQRRLQNIAGQ